MTTTATSTELLQALHDPAAGAWGLFVGRYRPLIESFAMRAGLSVDDARDVAQNALLAFYSSYRDGAYDRERGRLRSWIFGIARHQLGRALRGRRRGPYSLDEAGELCDADAEAIWESAWQRELLLAALSRAREEVEPVTFEAFELFAVAGVPSHVVAQSLGLSENAVYGAKRRVLARLRALHAELSERFE